MKKIVTLLSLAALVGTSYGQGYVTVAGTQANQTNNTVLTTSYTGGQLLAGGGNLATLANGGAFTVALLTSSFNGTTTNALNLFGSASAVAAWLDTGPIGHNNTFSGRLAIGSDYQVTNAAVGVNNQWLVIGWSTSLGATYASIAAQLAAGSFGLNTGYIGWSTVGIGQAGPPPTGLPLIVQGTGAIIPGAMSLLLVPAVVPEPGTMALAGLGGLSLLAFRRKK